MIDDNLGIRVLMRAKEHYENMKGLKCSGELLICTDLYIPGREEPIRSYSLMTENNLDSRRRSLNGKTGWSWYAWGWSPGAPGSILFDKPDQGSPTPGCALQRALEASASDMATVCRNLGFQGSFDNPRGAGARFAFSAFRAALGKANFCSTYICDVKPGIPLEPEEKGEFWDFDARWLKDGRSLHIPDASNRPGSGSDAFIKAFLLGLDHFKLLS